ncbi:MAG: translation initiation factor IF-3 [Chlamydiia bacterium]|nr:translation initiation factor IF-3 [Chlamydiia bacterium]
MRVNKQIRAPKVRLIDSEGKQVGVVTLREAMQMAEVANLDLVEVVPTSVPPVCKIIDYGKFRYDQSKREKESRKARHVIKVKEVKLRPNVDVHDFETKARHARGFLEEGNKVKITCQFRGREMAHTEIGERIVQKMCDELSDVGQAEDRPKRLGRIIHVVIAPGKKKK